MPCFCWCFEILLRYYKIFALEHDKMLKEDNSDEHVFFLDTRCKFISMFKYSFRQQELNLHRQDKDQALKARLNQVQTMNTNAFV